MVSPKTTMRINKLKSAAFVAVHPGANTAVRAFIAAVVIITTWVITALDQAISEQWDAVFLVVIAYYFKDRPEEDRTELPLESASIRRKGELFWQFALAMLLLVGTAIAFILPDLKPSISGAWVGAAVLAVAFYFKQPKDNDYITLHSRFRSAIALVVAALTIPIAALFATLWTSAEELASLIPIQWIALVFIVVTFYFKEKDSS